jgi:cytochrome c biogenesis protein CcmG/thiol:disulfide interchange protein DsbE
MRIATLPSRSDGTWRRHSTQADDGTRTRYLELGKLALYQVSYVRGRSILGRGRGFGLSTLAGVSAKTFVAFIAVLAVIGLLGYGLLSKGNSIAVGDPAPDKALPTLDGSGQGEIADYRGRWALVNFWASWCVPCRSEAPTLERFYRGHRGQGFTVLGIDLQDNSEDARAFVDQYGLTYPQLREAGGRDRQDAYGMSGFPESFLVDPRGNLALICRGPLDETNLNGEILETIEGRTVTAFHAPCHA